MRTEHPIGIVVDIEDPNKACRVKVQLAQQDGDTYPEWIRPIFTPGWFSPPEKGDRIELVLPEGEDNIEFASEVRYRGRSIELTEEVPAAFRTNYPYRRGYATKSGHILLFEDKSGFEEIAISWKGTILISINASGIFFGSKSAAEPMVLGTLWKTLMSSLLLATSIHTHNSAAPGAPTGPPLNAASFTALKSGVDSGNQLSLFIFGQKTKPT